MSPREQQLPNRVRPLYAEADTAARRLTDTVNIGLLYDRYSDIWSGSPNWKPETAGGGSARRLFLQDIVDHAVRNRRALQPLLRALHARRDRLWRSCSGIAVNTTLTSPMTSGLGMTHVLETGFNWDRNLGVFYLPASSLKGLARAWAERWTSNRDDAAILRIFGDQETTGTGSIVFHALYPVEVPQLRVDILNPHFPDYYSGGKAPADWQSPTPIFFLTLPPTTRLRAGLHPRANALPSDLDLARNWLLSGLSTIGAGAKTSAGYGLATPA